MQIWMTKRVSPERARELGLWATLLMLLGQHFFEGGLQDGHVASSLGTGLGIWLVFRYFLGPSQEGGR
ncbi:MAG: hypothetical protein O2973_09550 [Gemmatimonadetes bacterium]|nr:hypothetical protein [Gemmatimonadota bacterium]